MHNDCIYIGFIKISECCMARELIGLLRLLRLRYILRETIASKEFQDIWAKSFQREVIVLEEQCSGSIYFQSFSICTNAYLLIADQKIPAMDKLYYYVVKWMSYLLSM
jgi:hypothetical protein